MVQEAEGPDPLQSVAVLQHLFAWDAWAGARRDEAVDAAHPFPHLAAGDAGKLAGRGRDVREQDASCLQVNWLALLAPRDAVAEPCTQGAARSAERSCAALEAAAGLQPQGAQQDAALRAEP